MNIKRKNIIPFTTALIAVVLLLIVSQSFHLRWDLTADKRYTISAPGKNIIKSLDDIVYIRVYLDGEMPVEIKKFRKSIIEMLDELSSYAGKNIEYDLINPADGSNEKRKAVYSDLVKKGLKPITVRENNNDGGATQRMIFPGAVINYKGKEKAANLLVNNPALSYDESLNLALQNLEYELVNTIHTLSMTGDDKIAFIEGHNELDDDEMGDILKELSEYYSVERVTIAGQLDILNEYKAVVIAKPSERWPEADKFVLDNYIMNGGRTAWFIDAVDVREDSLSRGEVTTCAICDHNLNDQLFRYGVRINSNVIQDLQSASRMVNVAPPGMPADLRLAPWTYFPLLWPAHDNLLTKGLNLVKSQYPGTIDTVGEDPSVKKSFLLFSSEKSMVRNAPFLVSLAQIDDKIVSTRYNKSFLPVAVLLEGEFQSSFANRLTSMFTDESVKIKNSSNYNKMIVVSDGDIIKNEVLKRADGNVPLELGYDRSTNITYGNKEFVKNVINYLVDENNLMDIRNGTFQMRLLNKAEVVKNRNSIILVNSIAPILLVIISGILFNAVRRRKYTK